VDVVDGDTIKVEIDGKRYTLRYIGIDTPETVDPRQPVQWMGAEASAANEELVAGQTVQLEKDVSEVDRYGRLLRYVWLQRDGAWLLVNYELVRRGFAHASSYPPDVHYQDLLRQAEAEARTDGIGLWSASPTAEPTAAGRGPTVCDGEANAPGNDNLPANLNGEYVVICNPTSADVSLTGWRLQDEGPHHSYAFPTFTLRAGARVTVHSGAGRNTASDLYWNSDGAVWNNDGDCASLVNPAGTLIDRRCF
jgi:micrococcal nuclease